MAKKQNLTDAPGGGVGSDQEIKLPVILENNIVSDIMTADGRFTKSSISDVVERQFQMLGDDVDHLRALIHLRALREFIDEWDSRLKPGADTEARKYSKGENKIAGVEFIIKNGVDTYNWSDDEEYARLEKEMAAIKAKMDARVELMRTAIKNPDRVALGEGGEIIKAPSLKKAGGEILQITIPK